jgi:hypothetical protein
MNRVLDWANADDAICVDVDALWTKAQREGRSVGAAIKNSLTSDYANAMDDMGEFAIISAWANGKGKKG